MLKIEHVSKQFGDVKALNDVSFSINNGEILGLIGQNGAGKSTTFHSILNFIKYSGKILWDGEPISEKLFDKIGYLPEERSLMPKLTIEQQIIYLARLKNKSVKEVKPQIDSWMEKFAVKGKKTDKIKDLSKGNQQKVQLICTMIHQPSLIILDEPFSGLDPVNSDLLKQSIVEAQQRGAAIIFSSHDMSNVEEVCDSLVMLRTGEVVLNGKIDEVRDQFGKTELFVTTDWTLERLQALPHVTSVTHQRGNHYFIRLENESDGPAIFDQLTDGHYIEEFSQRPPTLDEIFRMKVGEAAHE
ncbi:ABC transporter ATP-binding protein [Companilactobacillus mishanensis]|uniref:ABC transporter ATP-binding protein n=1 Tax=Companilactobacillus mishanensis TaxID=2486008 RepID=A0ABW9P7A4_9LACO|nr:ABC transporter ATP-binding protein [Companilactobacillus mishanensis]MQS45046.1 ABC transporter ATP-binding protein [Companilactobacillus mishanensis]MQS90282.1 ABC transporter ATP-binding protein [Companilactobacillus mishanensis]